LKTTPGLSLRPQRYHWWYVWAWRCLFLHHAL